MGLRLVIGPAAGGKTGHIAGEMKALLKKGEEASMIVITPEQMTLKTEQGLMARMQMDALIGIEVLSFKRLAYTVFTEVGAPDVTYLDDVGKSMVLLRILREHRSELIYYHRSIGQKGFIDRLKKMITEIIQYRLSEEELRSLAEKTAEGSILRAKLTDICLIWHYFNEYIHTEKQGTVQPSESCLDLLSERLIKSDKLKNAYIYMDGFTGFTPQQYLIIEGLVKYAKEVTVCITMPEEAFRESEQYKNWKDIPRKVYFTAQKTAAKLSAISRDLHVKRDVILIDQQDQNRPKEIVNVIHSLIHPGQAEKDYEAKHCFYFSAQTIEKEVDRALAEILRLVREENIDYRDIAVAAPSLAGYSPLLTRRARLYNIPIFIDDKTEISQNPFVRWIDSLLDMMLTGFSQVSFVSFMKSGFTSLTLEQVDLTENLALSENWVGKERIIEGLKKREDNTLGDELEAFADEIRHAVNAGEYTQAILTMMEKHQVKEKLENKALLFEKEGNLLYAGRFRNIYEQIEAMCLQLTRVLGDMKIPFEEYAAMLRIGIGQCKMGQLPATLDEVTIGDLTRSKIAGCKALIVLGMQGGSFPGISHGGSLLTDSEREKLTMEREIAQGEMEDLMEQYYLLEKLLYQAEDKIYIFSHRRDEKGQELGESPIEKRIPKCMGEGAELSKEAGLTLPIPMLYAEGEERIRAFLKEERLFRNELSMLDKGRKLKEEEKRLTELEAQKLMDPSEEGRKLSITQLERYAHCPFGYFLRYGLRLKEREVPEVRSLEDGTVLHDILSEAGSLITSLLSEEEARAMAEEIAGKREPLYSVYQTSGRFRYYWEKLKESAAFGIRLLSAQKENSEFVSEKMEWTFGSGKSAPFEINLHDGSKVKLQGKIDRVDLWDDGEKRYIRIVDYKSGSTSLEAPKLYEGLQLQLPVYLEAGSRDFTAQPAGIFYFHLTPENQEYEPDKSEGEKLKSMMKANRMDGYALADVDVVERMDKEFASEGTALSIMAKTGSSGFDERSSHVWSAEQFDALIEHANLKISDMATEMKNGRIDRAPMAGQSAQDKEDPCPYCEYKKACPYDRSIPGTKMRRMEEMKMKDFWTKVGIE